MRKRGKGEVGEEAKGDHSFPPRRDLGPSRRSSTSRFCELCYPPSIDTQAIFLSRAPTMRELLPVRLRQA